jgi:hypothetical protein
MRPPCSPCSAGTRRVSTGSTQRYRGTKRRRRQFGSKPHFKRRQSNDVAQVCGTRPSVSSIMTPPPHRKRVSKGFSLNLTYPGFRKNSTVHHSVTAAVVARQYSGRDFETGPPRKEAGLLTGETAVSTVTVSAVCPSVYDDIFRVLLR